MALKRESGEICGLIGPNGAGKTTLFNCVTRFCNIGGGAIGFRVTGSTRSRPRRVISAGIARTFQNLGIYPGMTVLENVLLGARHLSGGTVSQDLVPSLADGRARSARRATGAGRSCSDLGLEAVAARTVPTPCPTRTLKRVEIARALAVAAAAAAAG